MIVQIWRFHGRVFGVQEGFLVMVIGPNIAMWALNGSSAERANRISMGFGNAIYFLGLLSLFTPGGFISCALEPYPLLRSHEPASPAAGRGDLHSPRSPSEPGEEEWARGVAIHPRILLGAAEWARKIPAGSWPRCRRCICVPKLKPRQPRSLRLFPAYLTWQAATWCGIGGRPGYGPQFVGTLWRGRMALAVTAKHRDGPA